MSRKKQLCRWPSLGRNLAHRGQSVFDICLDEIRMIKKWTQLTNLRGAIFQGRASLFDILEVLAATRKRTVRRSDER
jgi:hypothetical protein